MSDREISALRDENIRLQGEVDELRKAFVEHRDLACKYFDLFTEHVSDLSVDVTDIFNYLMPFLYKAYPDFAETKQQIDQVLARARDHGRGLDKKSD